MNTRQRFEAIRKLAGPAISDSECWRTARAESEAAAQREAFRLPYTREDDFALFGPDFPDPDFK